MVWSHYVPRFILKNFSEKLCIYNIKTREYKENANISKAFAARDFYSEQVEKELNNKIEMEFSKLSKAKLLASKSTIVLSREELYLIKKFLLISVIRSLGSEELIQKEKYFYDDLNNIGNKLSVNNKIKWENIDPPFIEKEIKNETPFDYWMRTINVVLDTNGTKEEIVKHPLATYPAYRWAEVINSGYLAFWDSEFIHDEFVITDVGMTSENEIGWDGIANHNIKKSGFLIDLISKENDENMRVVLLNQLQLCACFHENFMMFPLSSKRMIVEISPFYKFMFTYNSYFKMPNLNDLTMIPNKNLFFPNRVEYIEQQNQLFLVYNENDKYIYEVKKLNKKETRYCNELFLDRINTTVGFSSLNKIVGSIVKYKKDNSYPFTPRVDYGEFYKIINKTYQCNLSISQHVKLK